MKYLMVCVALLLCCAPVMASGIQLPIEAVTASWVQPLDGNGGSLGSQVDLALPAKLVGPVVSEFVNLSMVVRNIGDETFANIGVSTTLLSRVGDLPITLGLVYLPNTDSRVGWTLGLPVWQREI